MNDVTKTTDAAAPTMTTEAAAGQRMENLVDELERGALRSLTEASDKIADMMRSIKDRGQSQRRAVTEYAMFVRQSLEAAAVIMEPLDNIMQALKSSTPTPQPGPTITHVTADINASIENARSAELDRVKRLLGGKRVRHKAHGLGRANPEPHVDPDLHIVCIEVRFDNGERYSILPGDLTAVVENHAS